MPGPTVAQAGAPGTGAEMPPPDRRQNNGSRSSESQERQDGLQADGIGSDGASSSPSADIQVRLNDDPALGFCVFALRGYEAGDVLYTERTALEATHDVYKDGPREVHQVYRRYADVRKNKLHGSFPHLAWANNVDPHEAAAHRHLISSNITTKNVRIDNRLSAADHIRMRPDSALILTEEAMGAPAGGNAAAAASADAGSSGHGVNAAEHSPPAAGNKAGSTGSPVVRVVSVLSSMISPLTKWTVYGAAADTVDADALANAAAAAANRLPPPTTRKAAQAETIAWFSRYAFRLDPQDAFPGTGKNHQAAVYLLTDLINHRCNRQNNCRVKTELGKASLVAEKTILPGEELTIDYKKDKKDFVCRAECCAPSSPPS